MIEDFDHVYRVKGGCVPMDSKTGSIDSACATMAANPHSRSLAGLLDHQQVDHAFTATERNAH
jgi:hypothetical protein